MADRPVDIRRGWVENAPVGAAHDCIRARASGRTGLSLRATGYQRRIAGGFVSIKGGTERQAALLDAMIKRSPEAKGERYI